MGKWLQAAQAVKARMEERESLIVRLQARLHMPVWAELDSGASIRAGETVRYALAEYTCILSHTKALTRRPTNPEYWTPAEQ